MAEETNVEEELDIQEDYPDFDFSQASPVPAQHRETLGNIFKEYAQYSTVSLTSFLRHDVIVSLKKVEQQLFSRYLMTLDTPTAIGTYTMRPLNGEGVLEINAAVMYAFVNRMLGGDLEVPNIARPFTDIEKAVMQKLLKLLLRDLGKAWQHVVSVNYQLNGIMVNPVQISSIPLREVCIIVTFQIKLGNISGLMTLACPYSNLEPAYSKLGTKEWEANVKPSQGVMDKHTQNFYQLDMDIEAVLGNIELTMEELLALSPGDIIDLGKRTKKPIILKVADQSMFEVKPGLIGKYKGVMIHGDFAL